MRLQRVISGGQTGADQGGLEAAKLLGIETGGYCPKGWMTEDGPSRRLLQGYGLVEAPGRTGDYARRTALNVQCSDATIIFGNVEERGSRLTRKLCESNYRPYAVVTMEQAVEDAVAMVRPFLKRHDPEILNIAGNRESVSPGIFLFVKDVLVDALRTESTQREEVIS